MRLYVQVTGVIFGLLAAAQLMRALWAVPIQVADIAIPVWCSAVACVFLAALATWAFRASRNPAGSSSA